MADATLNFGDGSASADATFGTAVAHTYAAGRFGVSAMTPNGGRGHTNVDGPGDFEITVTQDNAVADPKITSLTPATAVAGSAAAPVAVAGTGFEATSKVESDGAALTTAFVSATALTATFDPGSAAKTVQFTVRNVSGHESNDSPFVITAAPVVATTAVAGTPGTFLPAGAVTPADGAAIGALTAQPVAAWTTGQYVAAANSDHSYWDGSAWQAGEAA